MKATLLTPIFKATLWILGKAFDLTRKKVTSPYPYDTSANTIKLPSDVEHELFHLAASGDKVEAVRRVTRLTGAGLRLSKDYVDALLRRR
jgi:hypothetical protein